MNRRSHAGILLWAAMLSLLLAGAIRAGEKPREECSLCGMWIDENLHTRHVVGLRDGSSHPFCSLACAAKLIQGRGRDVASIRAADYRTTVLADARRAHYVLGSDVPPAMGSTSTVAFKSGSEALLFQKKHGGRVVTFEEALRANDL